MLAAAQAVAADMETLLERLLGSTPEDARGCGPNA